jgi:hypothetical protein
LLLQVDERRALDVLESMRGDRTPVEVNTCLFGMRTIDEWADWHRTPLLQASHPDRVKRARRPRFRLGTYWVWLPRDSLEVSVDRAVDLPRSARWSAEA